MQERFDLTDILHQLEIPARHIGDQGFVALGKIDSICESQILSFLFDEKYIDKVSDDVNLIITTDELANGLVGRNICIVDKPQIAFFLVHNYLSDKPSYRRQDFKTQIGSGSTISDHAYIADNNVQIGDNVIIEEFVSIKENSVIGNNVIIRAGSVIGGEGFQFVNMGESIISVKHLGGVVIGDCVEIQTNTGIDKAIYPWDDTIMQEHIKIGGSVHIDHAVKIGKRTLIAANSLIAGNTIIGNDVWVGSSATIRNSISIENNARINMGAVVSKHVAEGKSVSGNFAIEHDLFVRNIKTMCD